MSLSCLLAVTRNPGRFVRLERTLGLGRDLAFKIQLADLVKLGQLL